VTGSDGKDRWVSALLRTIGHGTATQAAFRALLERAGVEVVVDVRRFPGSRRHPQFGRDEMSRWLAHDGRRYAWLAGLGGRRTGVPDSPNRLQRNPQFRAYADHMSTPEFRDSVAELLVVATAPTAVMCSESVWWRCHRRLLADHLVLVEGAEVIHLFHDGREAPHPVTPGARRAGDRVLYDGGTSDTVER
jgi:uncharacterized protein (DUF488 family)